MGAGMSGGSINVSQMTENSFKGGDNSPQSSGNPRVVGGDNRSTNISQSKAKSAF